MMTVWYHTVIVNKTPPNPALPILTMTSKNKGKKDMGKVEDTGKEEKSEVGIGKLKQVCCVGCVIFECYVWC
jgi:hypothetical protein